MGKIYITSDTHFGHTNIIKYCNRPFCDVQDMDNQLIDNWNQIVKNDDLVFHLGDFAFGRVPLDIKRYFNQLNGKIILILGNHDNKLTKEDYLKIGFQKVCDKWEGILFNTYCVFSHCQMLYWNKSEHGSIHMYGHQHAESDISDKIKSIYASNRRYNVGVDLNYYKPINIFDIINKIKNNNINAPWVK